MEFRRPLTELGGEITEFLHSWKCLNKGKSKLSLQVPVCDPPSSHDVLGLLGLSRFGDSPSSVGFLPLTKTTIRAQRGFPHQFPESESAVRKSQIFFSHHILKEVKFCPPLPGTRISISIFLIKKFVPFLSIKLPIPV